MARNIIVINVDLRETRVALIEDGVIAELQIERGAHRGTVGNVVLGKVTRVLPGMQAAFIDVGQERAAFLHVEDLIRPKDFDQYLRFGQVAEEEARGAAPAAASAAKEGSPRRRSRRRSRRGSRGGALRSEDGTVALEDATAEDVADDTVAELGPADGAEADGSELSESSEQSEGSELSESSEQSESSERSEGVDGADEALDGDAEAESAVAEAGSVAAEPTEGQESGTARADSEPLDVDEDGEEAVTELDDDDLEPLSDAEQEAAGAQVELALDEPEPEAAEEEEEEAAGEGSRDSESLDEGPGDELEDDFSDYSRSRRSLGLSEMLDLDDEDLRGHTEEEGEEASTDDVLEDFDDEESDLLEDSDSAAADAQSDDDDAADASFNGDSAVEEESSPGAADGEEGAESEGIDAHGEAPAAEGTEDRPGNAESSDGERGEGRGRSRRGRRRRRRGERDPVTAEGGEAEQRSGEADDEEGGVRGSRRRRRRRRGGEEPRPASSVAVKSSTPSKVPPRISRSVPITEVVREGDSVVVQISKEPIGTKGARVTSHVSLPGRYAVYLPTVEHTGISKRIGQGRERSRLRKVIDSLKPPTGGLIVRTVAEGLTKKQLKADVGYLIKVWADIGDKYKTAKTSQILYEELDLVLKVARDYFTDSVAEVIIDDKDQYARLVRFVEMFMPERVGDIKLYTAEEPVFDAYGIEDEIKRALGRKVPLPSGGSLIMDQAEALTAIDVNTGRYVGKGSKDLEETALKTNLEAVDEIAYQLRFRNIGGLVILDLIDMDKSENRERVWRALEHRLAKDKAKTTINRISELGLIEMTRKRTRESLGRTMHESCFYCDGTGHIQSRETIAYEILRQIRREQRTLPGYSVRVCAHPAVVDFLKFEARDALELAEKRYMRRIKLVPRQEYHIEQYDLQGR